MVSGEEEQEKGPDLEPIQDMAQALTKALGAKRLYMENNPVYQTAIANLGATFPAIWDQMGELELELTETEIIFERVPIYSEKTKSESISWLLFKDGVRSLSLFPGVEDEELVRFLGVLNAARALSADAEDDIITLLWEQDFEHITYDFVEIGLGDVAPIELETVGGMAAAPSVGLEGGTTRGSADQEGKTGGGESTQEVEVKKTGIEFDARPYFLERQEIEYLKSEIDREYSQDLARNVTSILFDIMELEADEKARGELLDILEKFIPYFLEERDFRLVTYILKEIQVVAKNVASLDEEQRNRLRSIPDQFFEEDSLALIVQAVEEASPPALPEEIEELVSLFPPAALGAIMNVLPGVKSERLRDGLQKAVPVLARAAPEELTRALASADKGVVHQAIELIAELGINSAVPELAKLLASDNSGMRRASVDALGTIGTPGAMLELVKAVDDQAAVVRIAAVKLFAKSKNMGAFKKISEALNGKDLPKADRAEKAAFFDAYAALAGEKGVEVLAPMLNGGGFMKKKLDPDWRACAAGALAIIGTKDATKALKRSEADKDAVVRNAVKKALGADA